MSVSFSVILCIRIPRSHVTWNRGQLRSIQLFSHSPMLLSSLIWVPDQIPFPYPYRRTFHKGTHHILRNAPDAFPHSRISPDRDFPKTAAPWHCSQDSVPLPFSHIAYNPHRILMNTYCSPFSAYGSSFIFSSTSPFSSSLRRLSHHAYSVSQTRSCCSSMLLPT